MLQKIFKAQIPLMTLNFTELIGNFCNYFYQSLAEVGGLALLASCGSDGFSNIKAPLHNLHVQLLASLQMCIKSQLKFLLSIFFHWFKRKTHWRKCKPLLIGKKFLCIFCYQNSRIFLSYLITEVLCIYIGRMSNILNLY